MKRFYLRFRIALFALALGLSSVNFVHWLDDYWNEIPVNLPQVENGSPIIVLPRNRGERPFITGGGAGGGCGNPFERASSCPNPCDAPDYKIKHKNKPCFIE